MDHKQAGEILLSIEQLRKCPGWTTVLLPEISRRIADLQGSALATEEDQNPKPSRRASRERHRALSDLIRWLDSAEENARKGVAETERPV